MVFPPMNYNSNLRKVDCHSLVCIINKIYIMIKNLIDFCNKIHDDDYYIRTAKTFHRCSLTGY